LRGRASPPPRPFPLAGAERRSLGWPSCPAQGGSSGGPGRAMPPAVAEAAVRRLVGDAAPGERVNLAFLGGEPLLNRELVRQTTELAADPPPPRGGPIGFSFPPNGTRLTAADAESFDAHGVPVALSLTRG